jgi:hypothetical protein
MLASPAFWLLYAFAAAVAALFGTRRRIGFVGFFVLALLLTPPIALLVIVLTRPKPQA